MDSTNKSYRAEFLALRDEGQELLDSLSEKQFNRKPAPGKWSVGECFEHLLLAGEPLIDPMEEALADVSPKRQVDEPVDIRHGLFGGLFIWVLHPDTSLPMPSPPSYQPSASSCGLGDIRERFLQLQEQFASLAEQSASVNVNKIRLPSPAFPFLYFRIGTWFEATIQHERRHIKQARSVLKAVGATPDEFPNRPDSESVQE